MKGVQGFGLGSRDLQALKANDIQMICHVPDRVLAELIKMLEADSHFAVIPVTREEEGVGVLCSGFLGGHEGGAADAVRRYRTPFAR